MMNCIISLSLYDLSSPDYFQLQSQSSEVAHSTHPVHNPITVMRNCLLTLDMGMTVHSPHCPPRAPPCPKCLPQYAPPVHSPQLLPTSALRTPLHRLFHNRHPLLRRSRQRHILLRSRQVHRCSHVRRSGRSCGGTTHFHDRCER